MDRAEQLRRLEEAGGDPVAVALLSVEFAYPDLASDQLRELTAALEAMSIPHWTTGPILAELIDTPVEDAQRRYERLWLLPVTVPFAARGRDACNVPKATRRAVRKRMAAVGPDRFRNLGERMANHLADDDRVEARIERVYHLLSSDPERGVQELDELDESDEAMRDDVGRALHDALSELMAEDLLEPRASTWVRIIIEEYRGTVEGEDAPGSLRRARELLGEAEVLNDDVARWRSLLLVAGREQGQDLKAAARACEEALHIASSRRGPVWRVGEADAHMLAAQLYNMKLAPGSTRSSERHYRASLDKWQKLSRRFPRRRKWRRQVGVAHNRLGDILWTRRRFRDAESSYRDSLAVFQKLVAGDPTNSGLTSQLAWGHYKVGIAAMKRKDFAAAEPAFGDALTIALGLAERDPTNVTWMEFREVAHQAMSDLARETGQHELAEAEAQQQLAVASELRKLRHE